MVLSNREIGYHEHTDERKAFWQGKTYPKFCYYHRISYHTSDQCPSLIHIMRKAAASKE